MVEITLLINGLVDSNRREIHNAIPMGIPKGNNPTGSQATCQATCQVADIP